VADRSKRIIIYAGISLENDLRGWLERLSADLRAIYDAAPRPASTWDGNWNVDIPRHRVLDAANVIGRAAQLKSLAELFPERLAHRQVTGRRFWMVVDAIDAGAEQRATVAKRWCVQKETVDRYVREIEDTVQSMFRFPLDDDARAELKSCRSQLTRRSVRK
jgi:hypothetical protein